MEQLKFQPSFEKFAKKKIIASEAEVEANSRARSAKLRIARKLKSDLTPIEKNLLGLPIISMGAEMR